jgi:mannitol-1-phosphate 5-dehydrogenase
MKGVHFGGGNIGRGFVAEFLHDSGYEVVFIDVVEDLTYALQHTTDYTVTEIGPDGEVKHIIDNYRCINSKQDPQAVVDEIASADIVTCSVGPRVMKFIAEPIAKGIAARSSSIKPLAVIACENAIGATDTLRDFIFGHLADDKKKHIDSLAQFANSAIDRIVPNQGDNKGLDVKIEKFFEWCVEVLPFKGSPPPIEGIHYVEELQPYIERKLFTVNTGHATAAYYGHQAGKTYIHDVIEDPKLYAIVKGVLAETAHLIVKKFSHISQKEQDEYVETIIKRISNPVLKDNVERVGRCPLRKLSRNERFIGPAAYLAEQGDKHDCLLGSIEQAFRFQDVEGDEESVELGKLMREKSSEEIVKEVCGLENSHKLFAPVDKIVKKVKADMGL